MCAYSDKSPDFASFNMYYTYVWVFFFISDYVKFEKCKKGDQKMKGGIKII